MDIKMISIFVAIAVLSLLASTITTETCPAAYRRFSAQHSFCKPANPNCSFISIGLQSETEKAEILEIHNKYRSGVAIGNETRGGGLPEASNMLELSWDEELADIAQKWSEQCQFEHDCNECRAARSFSSGQNIAYSEYFCSGVCEKKAPDWSGIIKLFYDEVQNFDKSLVKSMDYTNFFKIGHFTQLVWAETWKVGCGYVSYTNEEWGRQFYVCNYGPAGNMKKVPIYKEGQPCSNCPRNSCCGDSCTGKEETYPGLCHLLSSPPVYASDHEPLYFCAFEENDANCKYDPEGKWSLTKTAGGNFLSVVVDENNSATAHFLQLIKSKKDSCMIISLRKGPNEAGEKDDSNLEVVFEQNGQKNTVQVWSYPTTDFFESPVQVDYDGELKFSLKLTVPAGAPSQYVEIKKIEVTKEPCKYGK